MPETSRTQQTETCALEPQPGRVAHATVMARSATEGAWYSLVTRRFHPSGAVFEAEAGFTDGEDLETVGEPLSLSAGEAITAWANLIDTIAAGDQDDAYSCAVRLRHAEDLAAWLQWESQTPSAPGHTGLGHCRNCTWSTVWVDHLWPSESYEEAACEDWVSIRWYEKDGWHVWAANSPTLLDHVSEIAAAAVAPLHLGLDHSALADSISLRLAEWPQ